MFKKVKRYFASLLIAILLIQGCAPNTIVEAAPTQTVSIDLSALPEFNPGIPAVSINGNVPNFTEADKNRTDPFEAYSSLDSLGRCGVAYANICRELMPTEERGEIGNVKPSGWKQAKYPDLIQDLYLWNRCHLIGFQLAGENDNVCNLITGTRYLNIEGMLPYENIVADYVHATGNHVLYRVTPVFTGNNLVASGVQMEGYSVEDKGKGICFNVYCYNAQPGITINYADGSSSPTGEAENSAVSVQPDGGKYVLNINTMKYHLPQCDSVPTIKPKNKKESSLSAAELEQQGYTGCKKCIK